MKKISAILLSIVIVFSMFSIFAPKTRAEPITNTIFEDDFERTTLAPWFEVDGWGPDFQGTGSVVLDDGELSITTDSYWYNVYGVCLFETADANFEFSAIAKKMTDSAPSTGFAIGIGEITGDVNETMIKVSDHIEFGYNGYYEQWDLHGPPDGGLIERFSGPSVSLGDWTKLMIKKFGDSYEFYVNDELIHSRLGPIFSQANYVYLCNGVGVHWEGGTHVHYDDVLLRAQPATQPPVASFEYRGPKTSFDRSAIYAGSEVRFDAEASYDPDGIIISYSWEFGDGSPILIEAGSVSHHVYAVSGSYTVTLTVTDDEGATGEISKDISIHSLRWEIYFEIDYMTGHEPTDSVLDYIHGYFRDNGIFVYFFISDEISPADTSVTEEEFWQFEAMYNDVELYDDQAQDGVDTDGDTHDEEYRLKEKWVLYGTMWADDDTLLGFTDSLFKPRDNPDWLADIVAGNYIFIADQACDDSAQALASRGVTPAEVETVVLMHEIGHSLGIGIKYWAWIEVEQREGWIELYDGSKWSVMHRVVPKNCNADPIRYSGRYWRQKDMEYYEI